MFEEGFTPLGVRNITNPNQIVFTAFQRNAICATNVRIWLMGKHALSCLN
jgi:hypothetical protein